MSGDKRHTLPDRRSIEGKEESLSLRPLRQKANRVYSDAPSALIDYILNSDFAGDDCGLPPAQTGLFL